MRNAEQRRIASERIGQARRVDMVELAGKYLELERIGREFRALCPFHQENRPSFKVQHDRDDFKCFSCGAHGDAIDLVMRLERVSFIEAVERLAGEDLGRKRRLKIVARNAKPHDDFTSVGVRRARAIWSASRAIEGTLAETYLRSRGIEAVTSPSLRCCRAHNVAPGLVLPAMVAAVASPSRQVTAVQFTLLSLIGAKASLPTAKRLSAGGTLGVGAVRLAPVVDVMGIAEGVETALSATHLTGIPTWACLGAARMSQVAIPASVRELIIFADNDPAGRAAADRTVAAHRNIRTEVRFAPGGVKDWNDALVATVRA